jgi:hypothetical protein
MGLHGAHGAASGRMGPHGAGAWGRRMGPAHGAGAWGRRMGPPAWGSMVHAAWGRMGRMGITLQGPWGQASTMHSSWAS